MKGMTGEMLQSALFIVVGLVFILTEINSGRGITASILMLIFVFYLVVGIVGFLDAVAWDERIYSFIYNWFSSAFAALTLRLGAATKRKPKTDLEESD
jgi:hypothetical protein